MPTIPFYLFSALAVAGAVCLVAFKNPVSSAMAMVVSFLGFSALFIGLNAYFVGVIQILVYAGAVMVLFLFIIMLLDLKTDDRHKPRPAIIGAGILIPLLFMVQLTGVLQQTPDDPLTPLDLVEAGIRAEAAGEIRAGSKISENLANNSLPDVHLIGNTLFTRYNFPLQVVGVLLLVSCVGVVALSKKGSDRDRSPNSADR